MISQNKQHMYRNLGEKPHQNVCFIAIPDVKSDLSNQQFFNCNFENCRFSNSDLSSSEFINCQFTNCDLSYADLRGSGFRDAVFNECEIVGVDFSTCNTSMSSFMFFRCVLDYSNFASMRMVMTTFNNCTLCNASFIGADLTASSFDNCDLSEARFESTILDEADFKSAYNFNIDPRLNRIKNASFSHLNIRGLLNTFDIKVDESHSYCEQILDMLMPYSLK